VGRGKIVRFMSAWDATMSKRKPPPQMEGWVSKGLSQRNGWGEKASFVRLVLGQVVVWYGWIKVVVKSGLKELYSH